MYDHKKWNIRHVTLSIYRHSKVMVKVVHIRHLKIENVIQTLEMNTRLISITEKGVLLLVLVQNQNKTLQLKIN